MNYLELTDKICKWYSEGLTQEEVKEKIRKEIGKIAS